MAENKTKIIIETESGNSEQKLKKIASGLTDIGKQSKLTSAQVNKSTTDMVADFVALGGKVAAVMVTIRKAYGSAREAANFQEIALYTKSAAESIGLSFERLAAASQRGANGMADSVTIMKANLKALKSGLNASEEEIGRLWEIANAAGDELGTSIEQTFEQITNAIVTGNGRALISMGVLPESFSRASNAADLLNNRAALLKTVLEQLGQSTDRLNGYGDTAFDKFQQLETAFSDLKMAASEGLVPALVPVVNVLTEIVKGATKASEAMLVLLGLSEKKNPYFALSKDELLSTQRDKQIQISTYKQYADVVSGAGNIPLQSFSKEQQAEIFGVNKYNWANMAKAEEANLTKVSEALEHINSLEKKRQDFIEQTNQKNAETSFRLMGQKKQIDAIFASLTGFSIDQDAINKKIEEEKRQREKVLAVQQKITEEQNKAFKSFANLADSILPKAIVNEKTLYELTLKATMAAAGFSNAYNFADAQNKINEQAKAAAERQKYEDYITRNNQAVTYRNNFAQLSNAQQQNALFNSFISAQAGIILPSQLEIPEATKKGWHAIKQDFSEGMAAAMTQGIMDSNLAEALASFGKAQAGNYGSQLLGGLLSGGTKSLSGAFATGGAGWGLVAGVAIDYVASNWKKWTGDKGKEETFASVANTKERGSNAYLNTYKSELNPYLSDEDLYRIYNARSDVWSKGMTVSWSERDRSSHWLTGAKSYHDTTPQSTYDVIAALEKANELAEKSAVQKEREMDLMAAQGKGYQVVTEQVNMLKSAVDRISTDYREFGWTSGEKFSIDLSDNIQDLKKAYYEALREYGSETASRTSQKNNTFLSMFPFLNGITTGDAGFIPTYTKSGSGGLGSLLGGSRVNVRYDYYNNLSTTTARDGAYAMYNAFEDVFDNYLNDSESKYGTDMINLIKQAGFNQFNLSSMQYSDPLSYTESYLDMLEKQQDAAYEVMWRSEEIYRDMAKTVEERQGALQDYQDAQNQYYNTKLEIMANEAAKEEQIKKEQQQAAARSAEKMEALLGFTGEMARTGNNIYLLEGPDQIGALRELEQNVDDPQVLAFIQKAILASQNKNKFGKYQ